jgi:hypothetical protein
LSRTHKSLDIVERGTWCNSATRRYYVYSIGDCR